MYSAAMANYLSSTTTNINRTPQLYHSRIDKHLLPYLSALFTPCRRTRNCFRRHCRNLACVGFSKRTDQYWSRQYYAGLRITLISARPKPKLYHRAGASWRRTASISSSACTVERAIK